MLRDAQGRRSSRNGGVEHVAQQPAIIHGRYTGANEPSAEQTVLACFSSQNFTAAADHAASLARTEGADRTLQH